LVTRIDNDFPNFVSPDSIGFAGDPTRFFGSGFKYYTFGISSSGLSLVNSQTLSPALPTFVSDGSKFYGANGQIIDPATGSVQATLNFTNFTGFATSTVPAADIGRAFFDGLNGTFEAFDLNSLQPTGQIFFQRPLFAGPMVRWGSNGFAIDFY